MAELPDTDRGLIEEVDRRWDSLGDPTAPRLALYDQYQASIRDRFGRHGIDLTDPDVATTVLRALMALTEEAFEDLDADPVGITHVASHTPGRTLVLATTQMSMAGWVMRVAADTLRRAAHG